MVKMKIDTSDKVLIKLRPYWMPYTRDPWWKRQSEIC